MLLTTPRLVWLLRPDGSLAVLAFDCLVASSVALVLASCVRLRCLVGLSPAVCCAVMRVPLVRYGYRRCWVGNTGWEDKRYDNSAIETATTWFTFIYYWKYRLEIFLGLSVASWTFINFSQDILCTGCYQDAICISAGWSNSKTNTCSGSTKQDEIQWPSDSQPCLWAETVYNQQWPW